MSLERSIESPSDDELLRGLADLIRQSRRAEADLVAHIAEVDARRLYAREAAPSMFVYCTRILHLSEAEAYLRIAAARAAREHPVLLSMLADGRLHLSGLERLAPHLTMANRDELLARAVHKSKRQIEELVAELAPRPDAPDVLRKLPDRKVAGQAAQWDASPEDGIAGKGRIAADEARVEVREVELRPDGVPRPIAAAQVEPLSPARYKDQFTAGAELHRRLERLRALLRRQVPDGDLARVVEIAVTEKLERLEARRFGKTKAPRPGLVRANPSSPHVAAAVRRAAYQRDGGQCRFVDEQGRRCPERDRLEYHHCHPYPLGGGSGVDNIVLMCPALNRRMAEIDYGTKKMSRYGSSRRRLRPDGVSRQLQE